MIVPRCFQTFRRCSCVTSDRSPMSVETGWLRPSVALLFRQFLLVRQLLESVKTRLMCSLLSLVKKIKFHSLKAAKHSSFPGTRGVHG